MLTAGSIRKLIEGKSDDFVIPFYVEYDEVCNDYVFVRTESFDVVNPPSHPLLPDSEPPGILLVVSLVSPEDAVDEDEEDEEITPTHQLLITINGTASEAQLSAITTLLGSKADDVTIIKGNTDVLYYFHDFDTANNEQKKIRKRRWSWIKSMVVADHNE